VLKKLSPEIKGLICNSAEFKNDALLNRKPVKRFQKRDIMLKPRRLCDNPSLAVLNTRKFYNFIDAMLERRELQ